MIATKGGKQKISNEEKKLLQEKDIAVILRNIVGAMKQFKNSKSKQDSDYWKSAVQWWIDSSEAVLKDPSPDYLRVPELERAKDEFREKLGMLAGLKDGQIDLIMDDLSVRFEVIVETTRVNDLSPVRARIVERIREINTKILICEDLQQGFILKECLNELIELNNLIPK